MVILICYKCFLIFTYIERERVKNDNMSDLPIVTHDMEVLSLIIITTSIPMAAPYGLGDLRMGSLSAKNMWFETPLNGSYFHIQDWA